MAFYRLKSYIFTFPSKNISHYLDDVIKSDLFKTLLPHPIRNRSSLDTNTDIFPKRKILPPPHNVAFGIIRSAGWTENRRFLPTCADHSEYSLRELESTPKTLPARVRRPNHSRLDVDTHSFVAFIIFFDRNRTNINRRKHILWMLWSTTRPYEASGIFRKIGHCQIANATLFTPTK